MCFTHFQDERTSQQHTLKIFQNTSHVSGLNTLYGMWELQKGRKKTAVLSVLSKLSSVLGLKTRLPDFMLRLKPHFALMEGYIADPQKSVYKKLCLSKVMTNPPSLFLKVLWSSSTGEIMIFVLILSELVISDSWNQTNSTSWLDFQPFGIFSHLGVSTLGRCYCPASVFIPPEFRS